MRSKIGNNARHICIYVTPHLIRWCVIEKHIVNGLLHLTLNEFKTYPIDNLALEKLMIFNPTYLQTILTQKTDTMPVYIVLQGPAIQDKIISHQSPYLTIEQLPYTASTQWQWHMAYLYTLDHSYYYYTCSVKHAILFQYQLLAIRMKWHLQAINPYKMNLLAIYKHLFGSAYRNTQFAQDMNYHHNIIPYLFSLDDLNRVLSLEHHSITEQDYIPLLACCGAIIS